MEVTRCVLLVCRVEVAVAVCAVHQLVGRVDGGLDFLVSFRTIWVRWSWFLCRRRD